MWNVKNNLHHFKFAIHWCSRVILCIQFYRLMQLIFSTLLSLCSGAEKLRSILSKSCGVYLCAIVKWLFLPFCAFWATFSLHNVALGLFVTLFGNEIARKRRPTVLTDYDSGIFSIKCYSRICFGKYIQVDCLSPYRADIQAIAVIHKLCLLIVYSAFKSNQT